MKTPLTITPDTRWNAFNIAPFYGAPTAPPETFPIYVAAFLPWKNGQIDWESFRKVLQRIYTAGCIPVVNADTGFAFKLTPQEKAEVVRFILREFPDAALVAGVTVTGDAGKTFSAEAYQRAIDGVEQSGKVAIMVMISPGLTALRDQALVDAYAALRFSNYGILHELTPEFVPFGRLFTPYEFHGVLRLPAYRASKTSDLFGPAIAQRMALKRATGDLGSSAILSGVDYAVEEAFGMADGILMGAAVLFPQVFSTLLKLRRLGVERPEDMWRYDRLVKAVQSVVSFQFLPDLIHGRYDVGNYRALTALALHDLGVITSPEMPAGTVRYLRRPKSEVRTWRAMIRMLRETLESFGENPDLVR